MHNVVTSRRGLCYVGNLPIRNVDLTSLPIARIVLILKAELFLRTTTIIKKKPSGQRQSFTFPCFSRYAGSAARSAVEPPWRVTSTTAVRMSIFALRGNSRLHDCSGESVCPKI